MVVSFTSVSWHPRNVGVELPYKLRVLVHCQINFLEGALRTLIRAGVWDNSEGKEKPVADELLRAE